MIWSFEGIVSFVLMWILTAAVALLIEGSQMCCEEWSRWWWVDHPECRCNCCQMRREPGGLLTLRDAKVACETFPVRIRNDKAASNR